MLQKQEIEITEKFRILQPPAYGLRTGGGGEMDSCIRPILTKSLYCDC